MTPISPLIITLFVHAGLFLLSFLNKRVEEEEREVSYSPFMLGWSNYLLYVLFFLPCMLSPAECAGG